jgi:peptidoglycan/LPS O-acetylase OafA/YrhL
MDLYNKPKNNGDIDALRGLSILAVILLHINIRVPFSDSPLGSMLPKPIYSMFFWSGYYGVCIFFVISGFLICSSVLKKWNKLSDISIKKFYVMRIARIVPLLLGLISILSILHLWGIDGYVINLKTTSLPRAIFAALTFHINYLEIAVGYLPASWDILWSLSIEEFFYFFFPILCVILKKEWKIIAFLSIFFAVSPIARTSFYVNNEMGDRNYFAYLDAISMGVIAAIVVAHIKISPTRLKLLSFLGFILFIFIFVFRKWAFNLGISKIGLNISILALGISCILISSHIRFQSGKDSLKFTGFLRYLGRNSYEIYLTHMFIVLLFVKAFKYFKLSGWSIYFLYIAIILASAFLGKLISTYFSTPLNLYLRKRFLI